MANRNVSDFQSIVFWSHFSGLGNRLRALIGYQAMASILNVPFYLCWEPNFECDIEFTRLFRQPEDTTLISPNTRGEMENNPFVYINDSNPYYIGIWENEVTDKIVSWPVFNELALQKLSVLEPVLHIEEKVQNFFSQNGLNHCYGLHIRMTDNLKAYDWWEKESPWFDRTKISCLEGFQTFMENTIDDDPMARFFLATDNQEIELRLTEMYPKRILVYSKKYQAEEKIKFSLPSLRFRKKTQRTSSIENALIEMLLLSRCRTITGTYFSTFSDMSALIGRKALFVVHGDEYLESEFVANMIST